jgi:hypothetical protein
MRKQIENTASTTQGHVEKLPDGTYDLVGEVATIAQGFADEAGMTVDDWVSELVRSKSKRSATIEIPTGIPRLARQLNRDPEKLAQRILLAGIEALDDAHGQGDVFDDGEEILFAILTQGNACCHHAHRYTLTGIIDAMGADEIADCEDEAKSRDLELQEVVFQRFSGNMNLQNLQ